MGHPVLCRGEGLLDKIDPLLQAPQQGEHPLTGGAYAVLQGGGGVRLPPGVDPAHQGQALLAALQLQAAQALRGVEGAAARFGEEKLRVHPVVLPLPQAAHPLPHQLLHLPALGGALDGQIVLFVELDPPAVVAAVILAGPHDAVEILVVGGHQGGLNGYGFFGHCNTSFVGM